MIWLMTTAYDYAANVNAFPTLQALLLQMEAEFAGVDAPPNNTLKDRYLISLEYNDTYHDFRIRALDPVTCHQVAVDPEEVADSIISYHAQLDLVTRTQQALKDSGKPLIF